MPKSRARLHKVDAYLSLFRKRKVCISGDRLIRVGVNPSIFLLRLKATSLIGNDDCHLLQRESGTNDRWKANVGGMMQFRAEQCSAISYQPAGEAVPLAGTHFARAAMTDGWHETDGSFQVLFDSFSQPASVGMRATPMHVREMVFRAEPYQLDIQVEPQADKNRLVVTGQLLDVSHPDIVGLEVKITLSNLRGSVVQTTTNQFGEFRSELENSGDLEVFFLPRRGKPIVIVLRGALKQSSGAKQ